MIWELMYNEGHDHLWDSKSKMAVVKADPAWNHSYLPTINKLLRVQYVSKELTGPGFITS